MVYLTILVMRFCEAYTWQTIAVCHAVISTNRILLYTHPEMKAKTYLNNCTGVDLLAITLFHYHAHILAISPW